MNDSDRLWIIELGDPDTPQSARSDRAGSRPAAPADRPRASAGRAAPRSDPGAPPTGRQAPSLRRAAVALPSHRQSPAHAAAAARAAFGSPAARPARPWPRRPDLLLVLIYLLGPLGLLLMPEGRRGRRWIAAALVSSLGTAALAWGWSRALQLAGGGDGAILARAILALALLATDLVLWTRSLALAGRYGRDVRRRVSWRLRRPLVLGAIGFLVPGLGLYLAGFPRRAAAALATAGTAAIAILAGIHAAWWWTVRAAAGAEPMRGLEWVILVSAAMIAAGAFVSVVLALGGARLAAGQPALRRLAVGDRLHMALLAALAAFFILFDADRVARQLDAFAVSLRDAELAVIPLQLERAAAALDPSEPRYVLEVAALHDALGRPDRAASLRTEVVARWRRCETALQLQGAMVAGPAPAGGSPRPAGPRVQPRPARPAEDPELSLGPPSPTGTARRGSGSP
ncbi:MAG: hypothetical protein R6X25_02495 [Candidatus Krumholzibacteriia bacterium]